MDTIFIQTHIIGQEKIILLIKNRDYNGYNLYRHICKSEKLNPPLGPPPPKSSITQIASSLAKGKLGKNTTLLQGTKGCRIKHKFWK